MASRSLSAPESFLAFVRRRNPHVFGHHDCTQADYLDHVWHCRGLHICRGCTAVVIAFGASLAVGLATGWPAALPTRSIAVVFTGLLLLSLVPLRASPRTVLHDLRRIALGALLGSAGTYLLLADEWTPRLTVVTVYIAVLAARRWSPLDRRGSAARPGG